MKTPDFRLQIFLKLLSCLLIVCSCKKTQKDLEQEPTPLPPQTGIDCRLDSIRAIMNDGGRTVRTTTYYEYNERNQPVRKFFDGIPRNVYLYGADNKLSVLQTIVYTPQYTFVSEELFVQYDQQGRVSGYLLKEYQNGSTPTLGVNINYSDSLITYHAIKDGDSCCTKYFFYETGNNVRLLSYVDTFLVNSDTITYTNAVDWHFPGIEINMLTFWSQTPPSKNLPARHTSYSPSNFERNMDETYSYEFDSEGKIVKRITTIKPTPSSLGYTIEERWFYRCK